MNDETAFRPRTKSTLVTVIGWLMIIGFGAALFPVGTLVLAIGPMVFAMPLVGLSVVLSLVGIVLGAGLLKRRIWARIGTTCLLLLLVVGNVAQNLFFESGSDDITVGAGETSRLVVGTSIVSSLIYLLVCGAGIYALSRPDVKEEFGAET